MRLKLYDNTDVGEIKTTKIELRGDQPCWYIFYDSWPYRSPGRAYQELSSERNKTMKQVKSAFTDPLYYGYVLEGADEWANDRGYNRDWALWKEAKLIADIGGERVLDIGAGRGELLASLALLAKEARKPFFGVAFDVTRESAAYQHATFAEFRVAPSCQPADETFVIPMTVPGYKDEGYDVVIMRNVFECLDPDEVPRSPGFIPASVCALAFERCRPGGKILFKTEWNAKPFNADYWEQCKAAYRAAGDVHRMVPWKAISPEGRLFLGNYDHGKGYDAKALYRALTEVNPWEGDWKELQLDYFPDVVESEFYEESGYLVMGRP